MPCTTYVGAKRNGRSWPKTAGPHRAAKQIRWPVMIESSRSLVTNGHRTDGRRVVSLSRRQIPLKPFNPDRCELPGAALRQGRGADVTSQNIGVTMDAERLVLVRVDGIVPSACRQLNHATPYPLGEDNAC